MINKGLRARSPLDFKKPDPEAETVSHAASPADPVRPIAPASSSPRPSETQVPPQKPPLPKSPAQTDKPGLSRRVDLRLDIDADVLATFEAQVADMPAKLRKHVKATIAKSFAKTIKADWKPNTGKSRNQRPYRIVLSLSADVIDQILHTHRNHSLEPETLVLTRYLSPKFSDYIKLSQRAE
ncbi:hypothetical protein [Roseinatronobacter monicus]|uniref:Uncharacterized protein n=1 Tax=Roseinatronobacter monicus TaxID=393481 RepID=A0A543K5K7_9RHOB|nr:hypothetical protein [Roseinatronobacter monicus]TQM90368.1 hypothetical protein BD293_3745 [Roseinatronobacter monicus]